MLSSGSWSIVTASQGVLSTVPSCWSGTITFTSASLMAPAPVVPHYTTNPSPNNIHFGFPGSTQLDIDSEDDGTIKVTLTHKNGRSFEIRIGDNPETKRALFEITRMFDPV